MKEVKGQDQATVPEVRFPENVELAKAMERLGVTHNEHMSWLLRLVHLNLDNLSLGDWLNLQHEIGVFTLLGGPALEASADTLAKVDIDIPSLPSSIVITELQATALRHLTEFIEKRHTKFTPQNLSLVVQKIGPIGVRMKKYLFKKRGKRFRTSDECFLTYEAASPLTRFEYALAQLLANTGAYLRQCDECRRLFLADRRNKIFCSTTCLSRVTTRRQRQKERDRAAALHQARRDKRLRKNHLRQKGGHHGKKRR